MTFQSRVCWLTTCSRCGQPDLCQRQFCTLSPWFVSPEGSCPSGQCCETQSCHHDSITDAHVSGRGRDAVPSRLLLWTSSALGRDSRVPGNPPLWLPQGSRCLSLLGCFSGLLLLAVRKGRGASHWSRTRGNPSLSQLGLDTRPLAPCVRLLRTPQGSSLGPGTRGAAGEATASAGHW